MSIFNRLHISCMFALAVLVLPIISATGQAANGLENTSLIRLLDGGKDGSVNLAALEISLAPGFLTYWRFPGEAGVPPVFDWSESQNVANVEELWPAPERIREADSIVYGFHDKVIIPLRVELEKPDQPANLKLSLQYGVCKDICIPATATASIELAGTNAGKDAVVIQRAMRTLPKVTPVAADAPLAILAGQKTKNSGEAEVSVRAPQGERPQLFAEGPQGWQLTVSEGQPGTTDGTWNFTIKVEETPEKHDAPIPAHLTLRAGHDAIATDLRID